MDTNAFCANAPGDIISIGGGEHAFVPAILPPRWVFPNELWPSLAEAKANLNLLEGVGRTLPNPGILLRPLERREAIQSSRLEGTYATARELLLFEMEPTEPKADKPDQKNDWREVFNYRKAIHEGTNSDLPLSLRLIRDLHRTLLTGVRGRDKTPGEFRRLQVAIGVRRRFIPPPPHRLMDCLDSFEKYLNTQNSFDPLVDCFLTHYQFETIHPFMDGNGRVGRLLLAIMLQRRCGLTKPWLYLSGFYERNREEYMQTLFNVSAQAHWTEWVEFCLRGTIEHAIATVERCDRLRSLREDYMQRLTTVGGNVRLNQIIEDLFVSPFLRVADLPERLQITYPTARADVDRLAKAGILDELPNTTQITFFAREVFDVAYADIEEV